MKKLSIATILVFIIATTFLCVACSTDLIKLDSIDFNTNELAQYESGVCESGVSSSGVTETKAPSKSETKRSAEDITDTKDRKEQKGVLKQMLVKIVGENEIEELGDWIKVGNTIYTNPAHNPNIDIKALGYKQLFIDDMPSFDANTQKCQRYYYDDGEYIHRGWRVVDLTEEELEELAREREGENVV